MSVIDDRSIFQQDCLGKAFEHTLSKCEEYRTCTAKQTLDFWDVEFAAEPVDLNEDGEYEFIFMPSRLCESSFLYGSAGREFFLYQDFGNSWQLIGTIWGTRYQFISSKKSGYRDIVASVKKYDEEGSWAIEEEIWQWDGSHYIPNSPE